MFSLPEEAVNIHLHPGYDPSHQREFKGVFLSPKQEKLGLSVGTGGIVHSLELLGSQEGQRNLRGWFLRWQSFLTAPGNQAK